MPYSLAFRQHYPKFNGLIWAYHWLQVGIYEPLVVGQSQVKDEEVGSPCGQSVAAVGGAAVDIEIDRMGEARLVAGDERFIGSDEKRKQLVGHEGAL